MNRRYSDTMKCWLLYCPKCGWVCGLPKDPTESEDEVPCWNCDK
jgi:hypothetical protein